MMIIMVGVDSLYLYVLMIIMAGFETLFVNQNQP